MAAGPDADPLEPAAERWQVSSPAQGAPAQGEAALLGPTGRLIHEPAAPATVVSKEARRSYAHLYSAMAVTDSALVLVALWLAYRIRFPDAGLHLDFLLVMVLAPVLTLAIFGGFRLYSVHQFAPAEEFRRVVLAISLTITAIVMFSFWSKASLARAWVFYSWILSLALVLASRQLWRAQVRKVRARGGLMLRTLVVGTNDEAERLVDVMRSDALGFAPIGFVATDRAFARPGALPVVGHMRELRELIREQAADCVFVASSAIRAEDMRQVSKTVRLEDVEVRVTANLPEVLSSRLSVQPVGGLMTLSLKPARLSGPQAAAKRTFDLVVSVLALVVTAPLWAAIAAAIKLTSRGPVLYRQERVGQRGRPFTVLKFRTMVVGADLLLDKLRERNEASGPLFKLKDDPRVTKVGRWLRTWSLDELPQLLNVVKGEMSLVGPRPPLPAEVSAYEEWQLDRLEVPPGITGLWQVSGRSLLSFEDYVRLDLFYIENWSLTYDLYILARTVGVLVSRKGAY